VLYRCDPATALAGRDAVSPDGSVTALFILIVFDKFRALLISIPYAVNVPDEVKVW
jgi:hypothetical protein